MTRKFIKMLSILVFSILIIPSIVKAAPGSIVVLLNPKQTDVQVSSSQVRTSTFTSSSYSVVDRTRMIVYLNVSAASGTGGLQVRILGVDSVSGNTFPLNAAPTAVTSTGQYAYVIGPGVTSYGGSVSATAITATAIPSTFQIQIVHGDSSSYTYSVSLSIGG